MGDLLRYLFLLRDWADRFGLNAGEILRRGLAILEATDTLTRFSAGRALLDYFLDAIESHLESSQQIVLSAQSCLVADVSHRETELVAWAESQLGDVPADGSIDSQAIDIGRIRRIIEVIAPAMDLILRLIGGFQGSAE